MPADADLEGLLGLATVLTGGSGPAAALVAEVLAGSSRSAAQEVDGEVRDRVVQRFVATRRAAAVEPPGGLGDDLGAVAGRLYQLTRGQRACVVLSVGEQLRHREIATALDRPVSWVDRSVADASFALGAPPSVIAATLAALAQRAPAGPMVDQVGGAHRLGPRRTRRRRWLATATVLVVVAAVAVPVWLRVRSPYVRPTGEWSYAFAFDPPDGWEVETRTLTPTADRITLHAIYGQSPQCQVEVGTDSGYQEPVGRALPVGGQPGWFVAATPAAPAALTWSFAPGARAEVSCLSEHPDRDYLDLADRIRFARVPVRVPFDLSGLPDLSAVTGLTTTGRSFSAEILVDGELEPSVTRIELTVPGGAEPTEPTRILGTRTGTARAYEDGDGLTVCRELPRTTGCAASVARGLTRKKRAQRTDQLLGVLRGVTPAPDPSDPGTWFDARRAIPG